MVFITSKIQSLELEISQLESQIKERRIAKDIEMGGAGSFNPARDEQTRIWARKADILKRDLTTARQLQGEVSGFESQGMAVSDEEQARVFGLRQTSREQAIEVSAVESRAREQASRQANLQKQQPVSSGTDFKFSGKVSEISPAGETLNTQYYYQGKDIGRISGQTYTPTSSQTYKLGFTQGSIQEDITLSPKEVKITSRTIQPESSDSDFPFKIDYSGRDKGISFTETDKFGGGIISSGEPVVQEFGTPVITQQEAEKYGIDPKTTPVYVLSSKDPDKMAEEFRYASDLPYTTRALPTKDLELSNLANIRTGQEIYKLGSQQMSVDTSSAYSRGVKQAKIDYSTKPLGERTILYGAGIGQGVTSLGINTGEFMQSLTLSFLGGKNIEYKMGGKIGKIANYPVAKGTYLGSPSVHATAGTVLLGGAGVIGRARKVGTYAAGAEAASFFSPVRMGNRIYGGTITSGTKFTNIKAVKYTSPGEVPVTTRIYGGKSGDITMRGFERSITSKSKTIGEGIVTTQAPFTEVRAGGAIVETGIKSTIQPYKFVSTGGAQGYGVRPGEYFNTQSLTTYPGGISRVVTGKGITAYETPTSKKYFIDTKTGYFQTTGGVKSREGVITDFISGGAKPQYKTTYGDITKDFIYSPTGKYKVTPRFSGKELDLNKMFGADSGSSYSLGRGGSSITKQTFSKPSPMVTPQLATSQSFKPVSTPRNILPKPSQEQKRPSIQKNILNNQVQRGIVSSSIIVSPKVVTSSVGKAVSRGKAIAVPIISGGLSSFVSPKIKTSSTQLPAIAQLPAQRQASRQSLRLVPPSAFPGATPGFVPTPFRPTGRPTTTIIKVPSFLLAGFPGGMGTTIIKGGKRRTGFIPSFSALAYNLRGTYDKGGALAKSGIDFRPITPGFKFKTGLKPIRRLIRLK